MSRVLIIAIIATLSTLSMHAQVDGQKKGCSCGFQSLIQGGLVEGDAGPSWTIQTVNGMYYKGWFGGIGVWIDYYIMRTIPLFIDFRKDLFKNRKTPFLYADAGIQFDWLKSKEKPFWGTSDYEKGRYYDLGAGYKLTLKSRDAFFISAGYSMKSLREERVVTPQCIQAPCNPSIDYYNYKFSRLTFKVGWQFR